MARWMIGETYFHQQKYEDAIGAYQAVVDAHDFPKWQAAGLLQAGKCYERLEQIPSAVELYSRLVDEYPDTPYTAAAAHRLKSVR
jgi:TolA-binding protein